ncbi:MAG: Na+/H+ antiporter NhaC family protein, partial [Clostridia bacterium]|nr:Na+/H+ antiporter NhaC family protein [Clostridia bacterium]
KDNGKGSLLYLILPVIVLIVCCTLGMLYTGQFFSGENFITAFSNSDASIGLMLGSFFAIVFTALYYLFSGAMKWNDIMECLPNGFKAMVPAILILIFAWTLKDITIELGAKTYVHDIVEGSAGSFQNFLPAIIFAIACLLSFATGTSWGTFGMLIPIVQSVFPMDNPLAIVCISACMAGAVCGDHCSPISDTTIMSSAGAQCDHVYHVNTQLPYAVTCAGVSFVAYIVAGFIPNAWIALPIALALMVLTLVVINAATKRIA